MSVNKISKTTSAVKSAILRKSVRTLPNNPSAKGYKAEEIKKAMYDFATGESNSIMNEQDRIVNEINTAIDEINESFEQRDNNLSSHSSRKDNPHAVTATQIGLGNVNNTSDKDKPISNATQQELNKKVNNSDVIDNLTSDNADKPVSAKQAKNLKGLVDALNEEVKKKADLISMNQQLATKINASEKGATNGVAMLGDDGKVPVSQLPMSVLEQIIELVDYSASAPKVGANGEQYYNSTDKKIYTSNGSAWVDAETPLASKIYSVIAGANANKQYRWSGLDLVNIGSPLALGETSANAYPGDKGKLAYEHSLLSSGNPHGVTKEDIGLGNVENTKDEEKNVLSAKTLTNGVKINGETFDGSKDIEIFDDTKIPLLKEPVIVNENLNIFYDSYGRVTGGRLLQDGDIPELIARKEYVDGKETTLRSEINNKLNKNLGVENANKMVVTDNKGNLSVSEIPEGTDITEDLTGLVNQNDDTLKKIASSAFMAKELNVKIETAKTNLSEDISNLETELATTNDNLQGAVNRVASDEAIIAQNTNARHTHSNKDILDKTTASFTVADRQKLDGIDPEADDITIDSALSSTSTNPVQNKVIKIALDNKVDKTTITDHKSIGSLDRDGNWNTSSNLATINTLAFWNGAYDLANNSNLKYCHNGEILGTKGGQTINGNLTIATGSKLINLGNAGDSSIVTRGIQGANADGTDGDLHLQNGKNFPVKFGKNSNGILNADASVDVTGVNSSGAVTFSGDTYPQIKGNGTSICLSINGLWDGSSGEYVFEPAQFRPSGNRTGKQSLTGWLNGGFSGTLTANGEIRRKVNAVTKGTNPSDTSWTMFAFIDKNNVRLGGVENGYSTTQNRMNLIVYPRKTSSTTTNAQISVAYDTDDNVFTYAPTPPASDNSTQIATTAWTITKLLNSIYPIGSIYMSTSNTSPASFLGGTWTQIKGRFLLGAGANEANTNTTYGSLSASSVNRSAGERGGEAKNTLTIDTMPSHSHNSIYKDNWNYTAGGSYSTGVATTLNPHGWEANESLTSKTGNGSAHNNMPPYLVVYMWKRTA